MQRGCCAGSAPESSLTDAPPVKSARPPQGEKKMRAPLFGLNAFALAAFVGPALLIYASSAQYLGQQPVWAALALGALTLGCLSLFAAMMRLSTGRAAADTAFLLPLAVGLALVMGPVAVVLLNMPPI
jgi:FtsH-binding integral membrane protein